MVKVPKVAKSSVKSGIKNKTRDNLNVRPNALVMAELVMLLFFKSISEEARTMAFEERTATIRAASKKILKKAKG